MGTDLYDSAHSRQLYSAAPLGGLAASTITYPTQSHYPDTESVSFWSILIMLSTCLRSGKYNLLCHQFGSTNVRTCCLESRDIPKGKMDVDLIWPSLLVVLKDVTCLCTVSGPLSLKRCNIT